jgi:hypothetical protein
MWMTIFVIWCCIMMGFVMIATLIMIFFTIREFIIRNFKI